LSSLHATKSAAIYQLTNLAEAWTFVGAFVIGRLAAAFAGFVSSQLGGQKGALKWAGARL